MTGDTTPDHVLSAFFAGQSPPARDLMFEARVAGKVARRRAIATVLALVPWTVAGMVVLWALAPLMVPLLEGLGRTLAPAVAILATTALVVVASRTAGRRFASI